jgi:hypothetical protein
MVMRIRVTTRAELFEERKREHVQRGYRIEDEQPIAVNGLCSFVAVRTDSSQEAIEELLLNVVRTQREWLG